MKFELGAVLHLGRQVARFGSNSARQRTVRGKSFVRRPLDGVDTNIPLILPLRFEFGALEGG